MEHEPERTNDERTETCPGGPVRQPAVGRATLHHERYVVLDRLGAGGMGEVHAAWDRRLDRKVALKLLHPERSGEVEVARLLREAHALARLSHPNVVAVHDAGVAGDRVFVAMEYVDGPTLGAWLRAEPPAGTRGLRQVTERFLDAGRGLAAVHAAGLVHRDFKPDNVMIRLDGRVLVMDFGLARPVIRPETAGEKAMDGERPETVLGTGPAVAELTETGEVVGTPGFMAPEQLRGEPADARSDQYAFCVALRRAVEERPGGLPAWLRRVIERGTAHRPQDRFPSMDALLEALAAGLGRRRRLATAAAGVATAAIALGAWGPWAHGDRAGLALCTAGGERVAAVWNGERSRRLRTAFAATGSPAAERVWRVAAERLDGWSARWADVYGEACEATHVRGEQSPELLDRRMGCLDRRLRGADRVLGLLESAGIAGSAGSGGAATVEQAVTTIEGLDRPEECSDAQSLLDRPAPPSGPGVGEALAEVEDDLAEVYALVRLSRGEEALALGERTVERARAIAYPPLLAEALIGLGTAYTNEERGEEAERALFAALAAAEAGGDDRLFGFAAAGLAWAVGFTQGETADGQAWAHLAEAAERRRGGDDEELESEIRTNRGLLHYMGGDYPRAIDDLARAATIDERIYGADSLELAATLTNLAVPQLQGGRFGDAEASLRRSLAILEGVLGPGHPTTGDTLLNLASALANQGRLEEAVGLARRSLDLLREAHGPEHPEVATATSNLGSLLLQAGDAEASLRLELEALALRERVHGPDHLFVGISHNNVARSYRELGRGAEALAAYDRALAVFEAAGPDHPMTAYALNGIGSTHLRAGRPDLALAPLERALAIRRAAETPAGELGITLLFLSRALGGAGADTERVLALALEAEPLLAAAGPKVAVEHAEAVAWIEARRGAA